MALGPQRGGHPTSCPHSAGGTVEFVATGPNIESHPGVRSGKPCFVGTRITVDDVMQYLASGMSANEIVDHFPELTADHVRLALASRDKASTRAADGRVVDLAPIWRDVAGRMEGQLAAGHRHLLTEDVLRWTTIDALIEAGVAPDDLQVEVIIPTSRGKLDLVVGGTRKPSQSSSSSLGIPGRGSRRTR